MDALEKIFWSVSDPNSREYGVFPSMKVLNDLTAPKSEAFSSVSAWLSSFDAKVERKTDSFKVKTTVKEANRMLQTRFKTHKHTEGHVLVRAHGRVSIPSHLDSHIDFITGATELIHSKVEGRSSSFQIPQNKRYKSVNITPTVLRDYYGIPPNASGNHPDNLNAVGSFNNKYSDDALRVRTLYIL